ncbi:MAG: type II toxin-antitoxin system HicB family antitoxin [Dehalococcoidia bacterium]|nr:type II toxin-antitoxin system HicB family antitoxin [Dehalococcoidia bacterium]
MLSEYIGQTMEQAEYVKLEDESYGGSIPACVGVLAFGETLRDCDAQLRSTLEDWTLLGLKLGHPLPIVSGIDLNTDPKRG